MSITSRLTLATVAAALLLAAPAATRADSPEALAPYLLAPHYKLVHGDYAAGVPDTAVYRPDQDLNLYTDIGTSNADGTINAVIEIPQGSQDKWETDVATGRLFWELKKGAPRVVAYLGYPANYGMVPRTLAGDGDPLDVLVLGRQELRGAIVAVKVIGVMRMVDGGDLDDKLVAVVPGTSLDGKSMADLEAIGVAGILEAWFENYKGPGGGIVVDRFEGAEAAAQVLAEAAAGF